IHFADLLAPAALLALTAGSGAIVLGTLRNPDAWAGARWLATGLSLAAVLEGIAVGLSAAESRPPGPIWVSLILAVILASFIGSIGRDLVATAGRLRAPLRADLALTGVLAGA